MKSDRSWRGRAFVALGGLVAATALVSTTLAHGETPAAEPTSPAAVAAGDGCDTRERREALALEQRRVLTLLKDFRVLRNQADVDRLGTLDPRTGARYDALSHAYASMKGTGFTLVNTGPGTNFGQPPLLFYRPGRNADDVTDAQGADFPYTLVGWGYVSPYTPGTVPDFGADPGLRCLRQSDWFVHERSVHPSDTWHNIAVPPQEAYHGQAAGGVPPSAEECACPVGMAHGRFWDVHLWLRGGSSVPQVSMLNPGAPIPGFDAVPGLGFFFPENPPAGVAPASGAKAATKPQSPMGAGHVHDGEHHS